MTEYFQNVSLTRIYLTSHVSRREHDVNLNNVFFDTNGQKVIFFKYLFLFESFVKFECKILCSGTGNQLVQYIILNCNKPYISIYIS